MRWEQLAGWLVLVAAAVFPGAFQSGRLRPTGPTLPAVLGGAARLRVCQTEGIAGRFQLEEPELRRVAVLIPEVDMDAEVRKAVEMERSMRSRRRRPSLLAPPAPAVRKPLTIHPPAGARAGASANGESNREDQGSRLSQHQLQAIGEILFVDALVDRLNGKLSVQAAADSEVKAALAELGISPSTIEMGASIGPLCRRLNCDAVLVPEIERMRMGEGNTRTMSIYVRLRVLYPRTDGSAVSAESLPAAGSARTEKAPFQDRFLKDWPQLAGEAARQAAAVASRTLTTGIVAPFVKPGERVAIAPILGPSQADALMFHSGGRTVAPAALTHLRTDVTGYFHPDVLPLFPDRLVASSVTAAALTRERRTAESLWMRAEEPNVKEAAALGSRLGVQYVLLARVPALQFALGDPVTPPKQVQTQAEARDVTAEAPMPQDTASAEAVGALVRVSDGALLWTDRTVATMTATPGRAAQNARARLALSAERFALLQLERRFRLYRRKFE